MSTEAETPGSAAELAVAAESAVSAESAVAAESVESKGAGCPVAPGAAAHTDAAESPAGACEFAASRVAARIGAKDAGYFGPDSVSWRVFSDPSAQLGGVAAVLLQSLNPMMMRVFEGTSGYATDIEGRGERTGRYLDTVMFGDRAHADAAGAAVQRLHANSKWTDPNTGVEYRADTQEWLAWTHNTVIYGLLRATDAFGPMLTVAEQNRFIEEQLESARIVGIDLDGSAKWLPRTRRALDQYIEDQKHDMALTLAAAQLVGNLRKPALRGNPIKVWLGVNVQDGILSLLPSWALTLIGIEGRPMNLRAAAKVTRSVVEKGRAGRSSAELISEVTARVKIHPYRKVRGVAKR